MPTKVVYHSTWRYRTGQAKTYKVDPPPVSDYSHQLGAYVSKLSPIQQAMLMDAVNSNIKDAIPPGKMVGDPGKGITGPQMAQRIERSMRTTREADAQRSGGQHRGAFQPGGGKFRGAGATGDYSGVGIGSSASGSVAYGEKSGGGSVAKGLMERGFSREQAIAIAANVGAESGYKTGIQDYKSSGHWGYMQWGGARFTGLKNYAASVGKPWTDHDVQLDWIRKEYTGESVQYGGSNEAAAYRRALDQGGSWQDMTMAFAKHVERPSDSELAKSRSSRLGYGAGAAKEAGATSRDQQVAAGEKAAAIAAASETAETEQDRANEVASSDPAKIGSRDIASIEASKRSDFSPAERAMEEPMVRGSPRSGDYVTVKAPKSGAEFTVARKYASNFQGFLNEYEELGGRVGPAHGGLAGRPNNQSYHPRGLAIDLNQVGYGVRSKSGVTLPPDVENKLARKYGLFPGSLFGGRSDIGHFEVRSETAALAAQRGQSLPQGPFADAGTAGGVGGIGGGGRGVAGIGRGASTQVAYAGPGVITPNAVTNVASVLSSYVPKAPKSSGGRGGSGSWGLPNMVERYIQSLDPKYREMARRQYNYLTSTDTLLDLAGYALTSGMGYVGRKMPGGGPPLVAYFGKGALSADASKAAERYIAKQYHGKIPQGKYGQELPPQPQKTAKQPDPAALKLRNWKK